MCGVLHSALYGTKSLDLEENAQDATRKTKLSRKQPKYQNIPYQNQNFISISQKLLYLWMVECERRRKHTRTTLTKGVVLLII